MRQYMSERPMGTKTKVIMMQLHCASLRFLPVPALTILLSASAFAQRLSLSAPTIVPGSSQPADAIEVATVDRPAAPMPAPIATMSAANPALAAPVAFVPVSVQPQETTPHRFWDRNNTVLFVAVGAFAAADFCTTRANLVSGGKELNPVARMFAGNSRLLAFNFGFETAGNIGLSYLFHKTGHHKLERVPSFVNVSASAAAVSYNLAHR